MLIARARGTWHFESPTDALLMHYPDYLLVGVAVVISHVVTSLGQQVAKAREMGSYQLGELLGRGGMGEVYKATHRMLARPAAIKLIRPEMIGAGDPAGAQLAVARFRREAEAAANLRSPHTVELYDFGVTDDQTLYFVMELLEGMDLETLVRQHGPRAGRPGGAHPAAGVRVARRGARPRPGAPRHQAGQHPCRTARARLRLRQGARLRPGEADRRRSHRADRWPRRPGSCSGTPGYMAPEMALSDSRRWTRRPLRARVRRLLPAHRRQQVFDGDTADAGDGEASARRARSRRRSGCRTACPRAGATVIWPASRRSRTTGRASAAELARRLAGDRRRAVDQRASGRMVGVGSCLDDCSTGRR